MFIRKLVGLMLVVSAASQPINATAPAGNIGWEGKTQLPASGKATYYAAGVMEQVAAYRERIQQIAPCRDCIGDIAMMRRGDIGRIVYLKYEGMWFGPYRVVDCASEKDFKRVTEEHGLIAEVGYRQAMEWGMRGPVTITIVRAE